MTLTIRFITQVGEIYVLTIRHTRKKAQFYTLIITNVRVNIMLIFVTY